MQNLSVSISLSHLIVLSMQRSLNSIGLGVLSWKRVPYMATLFDLLFTTNPFEEQTIICDSNYFMFIPNIVD